MKESTCKKKGCNNLAISFSNYCGKHTANRDIITKIKKANRKNLKAIYLEEVELLKINFTQKNFTSATFRDIEFNNVKFVDCSFSSSEFSNVVFNECTFLGCYFVEWDCKDVTFNETIFKNCKFADLQLNQCYFGSETAMINCSVDCCEVIGGFFSETGAFEDVKFLNTNFLQSSFAEAKFFKCGFVEVSFSKTSLYDSAFNSCYFESISDDFSITGTPKLCDFRNSQFSNMKMSKELKKWNNFHKEALDFYHDLADMLTTLKHPNYLSELALVLTHLDKLKFIPNTNMLERIRSHIKSLVKNAYESFDYNTLGNIMSELGKIPESFRKNTGFLLPPHSETMDAHGEQPSKLIITGFLENWQLERVSLFLSLLASLEKELPASTPQTINYIERGSIIIELWGGLLSLVAGLRSIVDLKNTKIEGTLKELELQKMLQDIRKNDIELEHLGVTKRLEYEKAALELCEKKLAFIELLEKKVGFNYNEYILNPRGKKAQHIGDTIKKEFPILSIRIEE